jgi:predicted anti-sigma-YlaC factor YlaD
VIKRIFARLMGADPHECEQVRATFSDYLDGELAHDEAARLEAHVGICPRCRQALTNLRVTLGGLGRLARTDGADDAEVAERARQAWRAHGD